MCFIFHLNAMQCDISSLQGQFSVETAISTLMPNTTQGTQEMCMEQTIKWSVQCAKRFSKTTRPVRNTWELFTMFIVLDHEWTFYQIAGQVYCQTCDKNVSAKNFVRHMKDVHASAEEAVTCPYCSKNYKNRNSLQVHIKHQHVQHVQSFNWNTNLKRTKCV
jgi:hypothetical protein